MKNLRLPLVTLICTILIQLAMPCPVFADDATPPAPETTGKVQPVETEQPVVEPPGEAEEPALEVAPPELAQPTEAIVKEDTPVIEAGNAEGDQPDGILEALSGTDLVVLDEDNQPIPLATEAAAAVIANSDPAWCPAGTSPATSGCTNYATFTALISGLRSLESLTNGTVYVQAGQYTGPESWITLDGDSLTNVGNLTLIGGWNLTAAAPSQIGTTVFSVPVSIINWTHDVSVQDIEIDGSIWNGLTIDTSGQVSIEDVIANDNVHDGVRITAGDTITLNDVQASYNGDDGIDISSDTNTGGIFLNQVQANYNADDGVHIFTKQKSAISLKNITADFNGGDGLELASPTETANCSYSEYFVPAGQTQDVWPIANVEGPTLVVSRYCYEPLSQSLSVFDTEFNNNGANGLFVSTTGNLTIGGNPYNDIQNPVIANNNGQNGVFINIFASAPPPFPWEYYTNHAEELAGGPANVLPLGGGGETVPLFGAITTNNNQEQGFFFHTDSPGTWCRYTEYGVECASPPMLLPILGGEQINTGNQNPDDDEYPGNIDISVNNPIIEGNIQTIPGDKTESKSNNKSEDSLCAKNSITILQLPSGNNLEVHCPISGTLSVKDQTRKGLPAPLPDGMNFVAGINITLSQQDGVSTQVIADSGHVEPSFAVPADQAGGNLVILFWDASANKWVELPVFGSEGNVSLPNGGTVSEGVQVLNNIGQIEVSVNFPGIFVLAVKE